MDELDKISKKVETLTIDELRELRDKFWDVEYFIQEVLEDKEADLQEQIDRREDIYIFTNEDRMLVGACDDFHLDTFIDRFPAEEYNMNELTLNDLL